MKDKAQRLVWPVDAAERIQAARERGASFEAIAAEFGVSFATLRNKAISLGVHAANPRRRFTPEDDQIIRSDYVAHVDIAVTAAKLGRSYGAVRQRIFHHMKDFLKQGRTPRSWRVLRQYGAAMLAHGATPDEAAVKVRQMVMAAKSAARAAALEAKAKRRQERIALMLEQIAAGRERDAAIFEARALGAALEDTVLHELVHAIFSVGTVQVKQGEEHIVAVVATYLAQVVRDNPELMTWLQRTVTR